MNIANLLLSWYDANRRDLPWRRGHDPYHVWVSEVMLQQTRVEVVKPYYERWLKRFPTVRELAEASEAEVLHYWQGLGYYSRARNLHQGVREVVASYNGVIPDKKAEIRALAGVGDYTAGAILSIAYNQKEPAVDGNVLRVFSRLFCVAEDITKPQTKRIITALVERELSPDRPGDFNQAIMDLGAMICLPKNPRCDQCPICHWCLACRKNRQRELPIRRKSASPAIVYLAAALLEKEGQFLLRRRPSRGILANMWEFPAVEIDAPVEGPSQLAMMLAELGQSVEIQPQPVAHLVHTFSHRQWQIRYYRCTLVQSNGLPEGATAWIAPASWQQMIFAGPHRKVAALFVQQSIG